MIGLATTSYDPNGAVLVPARLRNPFDTARRGSVTATLDGGASVYDGGYSVSDRTLDAKVINPKSALLVRLRYLVAYYGQIIACTEAGAFMAIPSFTVDDNVLLLKLRLLRRLDI